MFVGREKELTELNEAYVEEDFRLALVSGQRGTGKTTLLEEFCRNKAAIFFTPSMTSSRANLNAFSAEILNFCDDKKHEPFMFWDSALTYIAEKLAGFRIIVAIDGLEILARQDTAFMGVFTKVLAQTLRHSDVFLVVSCSNPGLLKFSSVSKLISNDIHLEKFLTDENVEKLKENELKTSGEIRQAKFVKFQTDSVILNEGVRNDDIYKIISGRAVCTLNHGSDNEYLLGSLKEGQTFGEFSILTGRPGIYTVTAYTDMLLLRIGREEFTKFLELNAANSINIMQNMASMMNVMKVNIDMMNEELHERLAP